jgi:hypothetical protein
MSPPWCVASGTFDLTEASPLSCAVLNGRPCLLAIEEGGKEFQLHEVVIL